MLRCSVGMQGSKVYRVERIELTTFVASRRAVQYKVEEGTHGHIVGQGWFQKSFGLSFLAEIRLCATGAGGLFT